MDFCDERVIAARLETVIAQLFELTLSLAKDIAAHQEAGFEVEEGISIPFPQRDVHMIEPKKG